MKAESEERCNCGKLLFKKTARGIEFKCTRCKQIHLVPFDWITTEYHSLCPIIDKIENAPHVLNRETNTLRKKIK